MSRRRTGRTPPSPALAAGESSEANGDDNARCLLGSLCPLCGRPLVDGPSVNEHHLVPRSFRGRHVVRMHRICHNKIHSIFTERELAAYYHTCERLLENPEIQKFVHWIKKKDPEFMDRHRPPQRRR